LKIFLIGPPAVGKSTVLHKVIDHLVTQGYSVGGVYCPEIRERGVRVGFELVDIASGNRGVLSRVGTSGEHRVGKYVVNLEDLTRIGVHALDFAVREADVIIIDEVGPMEMQGIAFQNAILEVIESMKPVVGIIHWRMHHPVVDTIRKRNDVIILDVTIQNREMLHFSVLETFSTIL